MTGLVKTAFAAGLCAALLTGCDSEPEESAETVEETLDAQADYAEDAMEDSAMEDAAMEDAAADEAAAAVEAAEDSDESGVGTGGSGVDE